MRASSPDRPTSWTEAGKPSSAAPHGSASAGQPSASNGYVNWIPPWRIDSSTASAGGATKATVGVTSRSTPSSAVRAALAVLVACASRGLDLGVGHLEAALELGADVVAVCVGVLREETAVDVRDLAHEEPVVVGGEREVDRAPAREQRRRRLDARAHERVRVVEPRDADLDLLQRLELRRLRSRGRAPASARRSPPPSTPSVRRGRSSARAGSSRSCGTRSNVGLNPTTPHQAAGIRIDPPESVPRARSTSPAAIAAAEPPLEPPARRPGARGFGTVPKCGFCEEMPYANSCRFVLPATA